MAGLSPLDLLLHLLIVAAMPISQTSQVCCTSGRQAALPKHARYPGVYLIQGWIMYHKLDRKCSCYIARSFSSAGVNLDCRICLPPADSLSCSDGKRTLFKFLSGHSPHPFSGRDPVPSSGSAALHPACSAAFSRPSRQWLHLLLEGC